MGTLGKIIDDLLWNLNTSLLSFTLHRVTGIALVLFLFLHIWTLSAVFQGPASFETAIKKFDNPLGHAMEYTLFLAVALHLLNGLRITMVELLALAPQQEKLLWGGLIVLGIMGLYGVILIF
jgi:succinate dehydrogenase cytochrome b556 subunit